MWANNSYSEDRANGIGELIFGENVAGSDVYVCMYVCVSDNFRLITPLHKTLHSTTDGKSRQVTWQILEFWEIRKKE